MTYRCIKPIPTTLSDHDRANLRSEHAKVGDAPRCEQMQALQARAEKLRPIDLQDAELDAADPHTRLFLLAEYWQRKATKARAEVRNIAEAKRFDRERFDDDTSFADWAQSRARHALDGDWPEKPPHDAPCECASVGPDYCPRHTP
jgi:Rad3-related DNA helicase